MPAVAASGGSPALFPKRKGCPLVPEGLTMITRLAWRSIWRNRRRTFITLTSIGFGVGIALFFIALGEGMYAKMVVDVVRMQAGQVTLQHPDYEAAPAVDLWVRADADLRKRIEALEPVERTKRIISGQGIARSATGNVGVSLMGVDPDVERRLSPLATHISSGEYLSNTDKSKVVIRQRPGRAPGPGGGQEAGYHQQRRRGQPGGAALPGKGHLPLRLGGNGHLFRAGPSGIRAQALRPAARGGHPTGGDNHRSGRPGPGDQGHQAHGGRAKGGGAALAGGDGGAVLLHQHRPQLQPGVPGHPDLHDPVHHLQHACSCPCWSAPGSSRCSWR